MEKLLQSLCSAQSAKDIEGRIFNEDETKLPPSQTYEISKFSCIISRITTLALHFLIFRNVISLPLLQFPNFQHYIVTLPYQVPRRLGLSYFVICHFPPNHIFCPQSWRQVGLKFGYFAFSRKSFSHKVGELRFN